MPPGAAGATWVTGVLVLMLSIISVFEAAVAALNIPISPSGCRGLIAAVGATMMGNFIFTPSNSDERSTCDAGWRRVPARCRPNHTPGDCAEA